MQENLLKKYPYCGTVLRKSKWLYWATFSVHPRWCLVLDLARWWPSWRHMFIVIQHSNMPWSSSHTSYCVRVPGTVLVLPLNSENSKENAKNVTLVNRTAGRKKVRIQSSLSLYARGGIKWANSRRSALDLARYVSGLCWWKLSNVQLELLGIRLMKWLDKWYCFRWCIFIQRPYSGLDSGHEEDAIGVWVLEDMSHIQSLKWVDNR